MTHQDASAALNDLTALIIESSSHRVIESSSHRVIEYGPDIMATAFSTLTNPAMRIEREHVLQAEAHQRTTGRSGYANGFKPKSLQA